MSGSFENMVLDFIGFTIRAGGHIAPDEQYRKRYETCKMCKYKGEVQPLPLIKTEGCTICKCPFRTKLKTVTHIKNGQRVTTSCPHPDGNKWDIIDNEFKNKISKP